MSYVFAWADSKACKFPSVDSITEIDQTFGDQPTISAVKDLNTTTITVNMLENKTGMTNQEYYEEFLNTLITNKVTELVLLKNNFKIFIDTVIYDTKRQVIDEGIKIHNLDSKNVARLLAVDRNSDCQYVPQKRFSIHVPYTFPVYRTGITSERKAPRYIHIRNISIFAEVNRSNSNGIKKLNQTLLDQTISPVSPTIAAAKEDMVEIYNSSNVNFGVIDLVNPPRTIDLNIEISLEGFVYAYDEVDIQKILTDNKNNQGGSTTDPENPDPGPDDPDQPVDPDNPDCPCGCDDNNYFAQFERCDKDDVHAGVVVADTDYKTGEELQYPYSKVVKDIPDIKVGEYVKYVESIIISCL